MADFTTRRFADAYDPVVSYVNLLTASEPGGNTREGPLPLALDSDREAIEVGLFSSLPGAVHACAGSGTPPVLDEMWVSDALLDEVERGTRTLNSSHQPRRWLRRQRKSVLEDADADA